MSFELFVASRYVQLSRSSRFMRFMTYVAIGSVAIGTAALIITFSILNGFERELRSNIIGLSSHIRVGTFRNATVPASKDHLEKILNTKNVMRAQPFFERQAMILSRDNIDGVIVKGIPPENDISDVRNKIVAGSYSLDSMNGKPSVIIGKTLAVRFGLKPGDKIVLVDANMQNLYQVPKLQCVVSSLYETGMAEYFDDNYVFVALPAAQYLFRQANEINGYDIYCEDVEHIPLTVLSLQASLGYPYYPKSAFEIYRHLFVWIDLQQQLIPVVVGSLIVISIFNVIATLLLFVIDKTQAIGVYRSLGASKKMIRKIFQLQGGFIGIAGSFIGSMLALTLCFLQQEFRIISLPQGIYYMTSVPIFLQAHVFLVTSAIAIVLSLLSSVIPAWLASRLSPIKSIRFH